MKQRGSLNMSVASYACAATLASIVGALTELGKLPTVVKLASEALRNYAIEDKRFAAYHPEYAEERNDQ